MKKSEPFELHTKNGVSFLTIPLLDDTGFVRTAFYTRLGGVSEQELSSMNLSFSRGDKLENVLENYRRFMEAVGFPHESICLSKQVHKTDILCAEDLPQMRGLYEKPGSPTADGLITAQPEYTLVKMTADCATVYILDTEHKAIALLHSGWRGTLSNIAASGMAAMRQRWGTKGENCLCAVAPSIGQCCFEVGEDVAQDFINAYPDWDLVDHSYSKPHVDVKKCIEYQLLSEGVPDDHIAVSQYCTYCEEELFFSHRRTQGHCGHGIGAMMLL